MKKRLIVTAIAMTLAVGGLAARAVAESSSADPGLARALSRVGSAFGWTVNYLPPGPCFPPGPCKATLQTDIDHTERTDLDQSVRIGHMQMTELNVSTFSPCLDIGAKTNETGDLETTISILDDDEPIAISVPANTHLTAVVPCIDCAPIYVLEADAP